MSEFDFNEALSALRNGGNLTGKDGILTPLTKKLTEAALAAELETHYADAPFDPYKLARTRHIFHYIYGR